MAISLGQAKGRGNAALSDDGNWSWSSKGMTAAAALAEAQKLGDAWIAGNRLESRSGAYSINWRHYELGPISINLLRVSPQRVERTAEMARTDRKKSYELVLMRGGRAQIVHGDQETELTGDSLILLDSTRPWSLEFGEGSYCQSAHMSADWVTRWLPTADTVAGSPIFTQRGWAMPLRAMFGAMAEDGIDAAPLPRAALAEQFGSLLALACGRQQEGNTRYASILAERARRAIGEQFAKADLSVQAIADELGISRRYLHKILSESGTNFTALLEQARLERAALILRDRRLSRETIAEIAWACGFSDPSYFTRRFARRFGRSPKDYRRILD